MLKTNEKLLKNPRVAEILARAASVYSRGGYKGSSIRELAAALDIKSASLYHYFESKEDILFAIMWNFHTTFIEEVTPIAGEPGEPAEIMRRLVDAHIRFDVRHWNEVVVSLRERNHLSPERKSVINQMRRKHRDALQKLVSSGAEPGTWATREPVIVASTILDAINGLVQWYVPRGEADLDHLIAVYKSNAVALMNVPCDSSSGAARK